MMLADIVLKHPKMSKWDRKMRKQADRTSTRKAKYTMVVYKKRMVHDQHLMERYRSMKHFQMIHNCLKPNNAFLLDQYSGRKCSHCDGYSGSELYCLAHPSPCLHPGCLGRCQPTWLSGHQYCELHGCRVYVPVVSGVYCGQPKSGDFKRCKQCTIVINIYLCLKTRVGSDVTRMIVSIVTGVVMFRKKKRN